MGIEGRRTGLRKGAFEVSEPEVGECGNGRAVGMSIRRSDAGQEVVSHHDHGLSLTRLDMHMRRHKRFGRDDVDQSLIDRIHPFHGAATGGWRVDNHHELVGHHHLMPKRRRNPDVQGLFGMLGGGMGRLRPGKCREKKGHDAQKQTD